MFRYHMATKILILKDPEITSQYNVKWKYADFKIYWKEVNQNTKSHFLKIEKLWVILSFSFQVLPQKFGLTF